MLLILIVACCFAPGRLAAQDSLAGTNAGQERTSDPTQIIFCWCPPGKFKMGEAQVDVTLTRGFWLGKYEVTQAQYQFVMGENPSEFKGRSLPVEKVSWHEATEFCKKLTKMESEAGRLPKGWEFRLPTEAQWEYACRAGTTTEYSFGDEKLIGDYAWYVENSNWKSHPVGEKKANAWGLCDMHGNVYERCRDGGYEDQLPGGTDPETTKGSSHRVGRGGGWAVDARNCRSVTRSKGAPDGRFSFIGFRVALVQSSD